MNKLLPHWNALRQQLDANPRLKWGAALIVALLLVFVVQELESARVHLQKRAIDEEVKLRRIKSLQGQNVWLSREQETERLHKALLAELPEVATPGLAQAGLQTWLRSLTAKSPQGNEIKVSVDPAAAVEEIPGVIRVHATLSGGMPARQIMDLMRQIESATNLVMIETTQIRSDQNNNFNISMNAYYRNQAPAP
ncbi:hypothetical protein [Aerolutibacter ruishenii]|uniref:Uncharacterized protein n=1 Tax=Aerolutibacter ruishenii TaxID=686800 RepID=A0A562M2V2_9GAMM|nr:hypothetical protein [Lysobacter ruishenii]TWI14277.1 hypothetical protein IP93_00272 [Lysobacter ruishenii]